LPERTALAFSVGVLIAFSPLLGLHTIPATALAFLFASTKSPSTPARSSTTPFRRSSTSSSARTPSARSSWAVPVSLAAGGLELLSESHPPTTAYRRQPSMQFGDLLAPFAPGSVVLSVICSPAAYPVTLKILRANQRGKSGV
jgi:uncharacterized protein (DUF2062 family)